MSAALDPKLASILDSIRTTLGGAPDSDGAAGEEIEGSKAGSSAPRPFVPRSLPLPGPQHSVEEFLAELIRPQVSLWLDRHLPEIVQSLVQDEIARLTGSDEGQASVSGSETDMTPE